ncbi:zinc finger protein ZAT12-like [Panicum virgatum]|uniref:zinc finger protein ZAT12-like n=1 Tax=Panicum virgatum TaxID=38727 RepID=UPI0019D517DC|nr:zinc finger protein ZAT12-like [Panicum virgatum]
MDDDVLSDARPASRNGFFLLLSLSLSPTSKAAIAKGGGRHHQHHRSRAGVVGGAFRCRTCGHAFATFQAMGGPRTSHKRPRWVRTDGLDLLLGARPGKGAAASDVHRCHAYGVVFPTGQVLGGHMRRHRAAFDAAAREGTTKPVVVSAESSSEEVDDDAGHLSSSNLIHFI